MASERQVVLTLDRGTFSVCNRSSALGYFACMPARRVPRLFMDVGFTPPVPVTRSGEISRQRDLQLAPQLAPTAIGRLRNAAARRMVTFRIGQMTRTVGRIFNEIRESHGQKSRDFTPVDLDSPFGAVRAIYWIALSATTSRSRTADLSSHFSPVRSG